MVPVISRRQFMAGGVLYGAALSALCFLPRPRAWAAAEASTLPVVLSTQQWKLVEAITARILPSDDTPGAREAGCVNFIDKALAHEDSALRSTYEQGAAGLEAVAHARFQRPFVELIAVEQDALLTTLQDGAADAWPAQQVTQQEFFDTVRMHTVLGFLSDPAHGGNRDYTGWKLTGYPGPAHHRGGYSPAQMIGEEKIVAVWEDED
jgi:gluconate 2-dehydrogenase gamma chain